MTGTVDPTVTTTIDRIMTEIELINLQLDDLDNRIAAMERKVSLLPLSSSAQMQLAPPTVAETSEGELAHCFPSRSALLSMRTPALPTHVSHGRVAPACAHIRTTLCTATLPRPPSLPSIQAVAHTHVAACAWVAAASKAQEHSCVTAAAKDRTQATAQTYRGVHVALLGRREICQCIL
jgi:hypothetical protein